jgi:hypothetical protein
MFWAGDLLQDCKNFFGGDEDFLHPVFRGVQTFVISDLKKEKGFV